MVCGGIRVSGHDRGRDRSRRGGGLDRVQLPLPCGAMSDTFEAETAVPRPDQPKGRRNTRLALTILAHPDASRVGAQVWLEGSQVDLSRLEPVFGDGQPLRDRHLSRSPVRLLPAGTLGVTFSARDTSTALEVEGQAVASSLTVPWEAVDAGVVVTLAGRVALVLVRRPEPEPTADLGLLGVSAAIERVRREILQVADLDVLVLVRGESGVGKERVAAAIHAASPRVARRCVAVNMAAVPPSLAASELFGHTQGAFSGAGAARDGHFVHAHRGTLFLDEVGDTPSDVQPMLLRVLETREVRPVGSDVARLVDVRVIAATDASLEARVSSGRFRAPLLHRLAEFQIWVPPLRQRREDIGVLASAFAAEERVRVGDPPRWGLPAPLVARWARLAWPGNVRELHNSVRQLVIRNRGRESIVWDEVAVGARPPDRSARRAADLSADEVRDRLEAVGWQVKQAAAELGVSRAALYRRMEKLGIERPE